MNEKDKNILFDLLQDLLEDATIKWSGGYDFGTPENITHIIEELESKFEIKSK